MLTSLVIVSLVVLLTAVDVIRRLAIDKPIYGVPDITMLSMLLLCWLSVGYVAFKRREISIDIFNPKLPSFLEGSLDKLRLALCLFIIGVIAWQGYVQGIHIWEKHELSVDLRLPLFPFYFVICFGGILYCIEIILELIFGVKESQSEDEKGEFEF